MQSREMRGGIKGPIVQPAKSHQKYGFQKWHLRRRLKRCLLPVLLVACPESAAKPFPCPSPGAGNEHPQKLKAERNRSRNPKPAADIPTQGPGTASTFSRRAEPTKAPSAPAPRRGLAAAGAGAALAGEALLRLPARLRAPHPGSGTPSPALSPLIPALGPPPRPGSGPPQAGPAMPALLALLAAALLALLGALRAAGPGARVPLKRWALAGLLLFHGAWRQRVVAGGTEEPRRPRLLWPDPHAFDSVYFTGFVETNKTFVIARLAKRPHGICEMWLFLRVDGIGEFEHPQHPNMMVSDESEEIWSGGGLTIEYLELQARWKISFDGLLRKGPYRQQWSEEEGELVPVKFSFHWENFTEVFNFSVDSHPSTFARAFAQEPWTIEFFQRVKKQREQHFRHEQWGQSVGEIEIENHEKTELSLKGIRSHSYGVRNWSEIYRYVMILARFEDGTAAHLTVINMPATTTNLTVGYVFFPDGKKAGIEWSNASLAEMADDGVIRDEYRVSFTAGGKYFDVSARLDKQACPVVYNGLTGSGVFHECIADFQLNGLTHGWGLAEFYYRDEAAQLVPNLQLGSKANGPNLSSQRPVSDGSPP